MCKKIDYGHIEKGIGYYLKGNEPHPMVMPIVFAGCNCGAMIWGTIEGGVLWVELEPEPGMNLEMVKKLSADIVRTFKEED